VIFTGPPGVGKSHLLNALGLALCTRGYRVYFSTAVASLMRLIAAKRSGLIAREYRTLDFIDVLLIDELD
jgi:DNA replication protein DnaC